MKDIEKVPNEELKHIAKKEDPRFLSVLLKDKDCLMDAISFNIKPNHFWFDEDRFLFKLMQDYYVRYGSLLTRSAMDSLMDKQDSYSEEQKSARRMYWDKIYNTESSSEDYELLKQSINGRYVQEQNYNLLRGYIDKIVGATSGQIDIARDLRKDFLGVEGIDADSYCLTMGIDEVLVSPFNILQTWIPSRTGSIRSRMIRSGLLSRATFNPLLPS